MSPAHPRAGGAWRLGAVGLAAWVCIQAGIKAAHSPGLSHFGRPGLMGPLLWMAALAFGTALLIAPDRRAVARRLTLLLLLAALLPGGLVPAAPGLVAVLLGFTLVVANPFLRPGPAAKLAALALLLALPALAGSLYPHGGWAWLVEILPALGLALLLPSLFGPRDVVWPVALLVFATAVGCLAALSDYASLMRQLDLPLDTVLRTRLRLLDIHPNLVVPHLATTLVLGAALAWGPAGAARPLLRRALLGALLACAAALTMVRSRTGFLVTGAGLGLLAASLRGGRLLRLAHPLAALAVVAALVIPCTNLVHDDVARLESSKASKAWIFRAYMWGMGRDTLAAAPWHGFGPHTRYVQGRFAEPGRYDGLDKDDHPHNVALLVGESLGWPGLLALALLLGLSLRRPRGDPGSNRVLAHACSAALLAVWGANAIDLGGADRTLFPTLVLLLLGLREAAERQADTPPAAAAPVAWRAGTTLVAALAVWLGLALTMGQGDKASARQRIELLEQRRTEPASEAQARVEPALAEQAATSLEAAQTWLPLDPEVPVLQARLASLGGDTAAAVALRQLATERMRDEQGLLYSLALARAADGDLDLFGRLAAIETALALDPHGGQAWRLHLDLAVLRMQTGDRSGALEALTSALLLNPGAAGRLPLVETPAGPQLDLDSTRDDAGTLVGIGDIGSQIRARLSQHADDPATDLRLRLRLVEIVTAMGLKAAADDLADQLLADQPQYLALRRAGNAQAEGRWQDALDELTGLGDHGHFHLYVDELEARARVEPLDLPAFEACLQRALAALEDVKFEAETVARLAAARQRLAERQGDAIRAAHFADAVDFARH